MMRSPTPLSALTDQNSEQWLAFTQDDLSPTGQVILSRLKDTLQKNEPVDGLVDWLVEQINLEQLSLSTLNQTINELHQRLVEQPAISCKLCQQLDAALDQLWDALLETFDRYRDKTAMRRVREMEEMVRALANSNEETDRALIQLHALYDIAQQNGQLYEQVQQLNQTLEQRIAERTHELEQEKERLSHALRQQELESAQKQAILVSIADGVIACDLTGSILLVNSATESILGQPLAVLAQKSAFELFESFEESGQQKILRILTDSFDRPTDPHRPLSEMQEVILESGRRTISARLTVARTTDQSPIGVVIVLRDITPEVEADRAKSEFISTVSHELRTPMTSIKGYTDLLRQEAIGPLNKRQRHFLKTVQRNADRLSMLINDLLDISRIEMDRVDLHLEDIQLEILVDQVVESLLLPAQNKRLELTMQAAPCLPKVRAAWDRITQVLVNLVGNAIAYTERGGVHISLQEVNGAVQISVADTGIGIKPEELPRIFDRFYRSDHEVVQANSGTGLGLAIARSYIEMHNGRLWVESEPGKGSVFTIVLPALENKQ